MANRFSEVLKLSAFCKQRCVLRNRAGVRSSLQCSLSLGLNEGLLGDEDTIKELTLVLAADLADLLDLGAAEGERGVVDAVEDELTLDVVGQLRDRAGLHLDDLVLLATEEVLHDNLRSVLGDDHVDGEVGMDKSHLVAEALQKGEGV